MCSLPPVQVAEDNDFDRKWRTMHDIFHILLSRHIIRGEPMSGFPHCPECNSEYIYENRGARTD
ncbi:hypothetical protein AL013_12090 [Mariprofundus ferrooxydans]|uniref:Uncharacterized protein n=1 Tax=Mariprofundus ferrooxydans PV-1 TaxID=314345 RepID=Q0F378_9PROT|nr:hypothetical protein SPV1_04563 [Mariprofundus ferrooxydans PV-1]KON46649.1 hypothetical protein AL013_12090 [Mariprofundus ferrooxydans]